MLHCCRLIEHVTETMLNAFKPVELLAPGAQEHASRHQDLHSAAVAKLSHDSFLLQHYTLNFLSDLLSAKPAVLQHLRAESVWELAYGRQFFFWGRVAHTGTNKRFRQAIQKVDGRQSDYVPVLKALMHPTVQQCRH